MYIWIIILIVVFGIWGFCIQIVDDKEKAKQLEKFEKQMKNCGYEEAIEISHNCKIYISKKSKIWRVTLDNRIYKFKDIISCEILENDISILSAVSKKHVSVSKAIVGNALFGPAGAIIGGTSGKVTTNSTPQENCNSLIVKIVLNDLDNPIKFINILTNCTISKSSYEYKEKMETAQKIVSLFQVMMHNK